jgi:DNA modification methylase
VTYFGLRDYSTGTWEGGDDPACDHKADIGARASSGLSGALARKDGRIFTPFRDTCGKCGARRIDQQIGLEPDPASYIAALVAVFREVKRVLRPDGLCFVNLGDSMSATGKSGGGRQGERWAECGADVVGPRGGKWSPPPPGLAAKNLLMMPARVAIALQADGWVLRSQMPWVKRSCMPESTNDRPTSAIEYVYMFTKKPRYFWDATAVQVAGAVPAGTLGGKASAQRSGTNGVNSRPAEYAVYSGTRNWRNSDLFFQSLEPPHGLICASDGLPVALDVNPEATSLAHFACFPTKLVSPLVRAATSERGCCSACGSPWVRVVEKGDLVPTRRQYDKRAYGVVIENPDPGDAGRNRARDGHRANMAFEKTTTGWSASCSCSDAGEPVPCTVLDPFMGSGTVAVVCNRLGRDAIGIELSSSYIAMSEARLRADAGMFADLDGDGDGDMLRDLLPPTNDAPGQAMADLFSTAAE